MNMVSTEPVATLRVTSDTLDSFAPPERGGWDVGEELVVFEQRAEGGLVAFDARHLATVNPEDCVDVMGSVEALHDKERCKAPYIADVCVDYGDDCPVALVVHRDPVTGWLFGIDLSFVEQVADEIIHPYRPGYNLILEEYPA